jgi:chromosome segregation ATPase
MTTPDPRRRPSDHSTGDPRLKTIVRPDAMPPSPASESEDKSERAEHDESSAKRKRQDGPSRTLGRTHAESSKKQRSEGHGADAAVLAFQAATMGVFKAVANTEFEQKFGEQKYELKKYIKDREYAVVKKLGKDLTARVDPIETKLAEMKKVAETHEEHVSALLGDVTELRAQSTNTDNLAREVTGLTGESNSLTKAVTNLTEAVTTHENRLDIISKTTSTMNHNLNTIRASCTAIESKYDADVKGLKLYRELSKDTVKEVEKQLATVKSDVANLGIDDRQNLENVKNALEVKLEALDLELRNAKDKSDDRLEVRMGDAKDALDKKLKSIDDRLDDHKRKLDNHKDKLDNVDRKFLRHARTLVEAEKRHQEAIDVAKEQHTNDLAEVKEKYETALTEVKEKHNDDLASLRRDMGKLVEDAMRGIRSEQRLDQVKLEQVQIELKELRATRGTQSSSVAVDTVEALRNTIVTQIEALTDRVARIEEAKVNSDREIQLSVSASQKQYANLDKRVENVETLCNNIGTQIDHVEQVKETGRERQSLTSSIDTRVENLEALQKTTTVNLANNNRSINNIVNQQAKIDAAIPSLATKKALKDLKDPKDSNTTQLREEIANLNTLLSNKIETVYSVIVQKCDEGFARANQTCQDRIDGANTRIAQLEDSETEVHVSSTTHYTRIDSTNMPTSTSFPAKHPPTPRRPRQPLQWASASNSRLPERLTVRRPTAPPDKPPRPTRPHNRIRRSSRSSRSA